MVHEYAGGADNESSAPSEAEEKIEPQRRRWTVIHGVALMTTTFLLTLAFGGLLFWRVLSAL